jgi:hypothetical protein
MGGHGVRGSPFGSKLYAIVDKGGKREVKTGRVALPAQRHRVP